MKAITNIIPPNGKNVLIDGLYTPLGSVFIKKVEYNQYRIEDEVKHNFVTRTIYLEV